ncbi:MAG: DUF1343 domain-containing protein [Bdellovibrionales bacterium]|nr:DUF1343 domain-containing protein [Bdellovibrionales bacterium]
MFETGLDVFLKKEYRKYQKLRLAFLCNQASVNVGLRHLSHLVTEKKYKLDVTCFLGPQHGIRGEKQDNMIESEDFIDPTTQLPVISLYSKTREPSNEVMDRFDVLLVDLQDIGTRIYTFMYTMANCMRAAKRTGKKIVVLDRPNPINGLDTEGHVLDTDFISFVGQFPMCVRHGMTMGELAYLFNETFGIRCDLEVIKMKGWKRAWFADNLKRIWIPPSPNIPTSQTALTFPGTVLFEGTNVSEGRGTTTPLEWVGAGYINPDHLAQHMNSLKLKGVYFRPVYFQPTYQKGKDQVCGGVQLHVLNRRLFKPYAAGVHLLASIKRLYPDKFEWKKPPYEYEYDKMPIDLIAGTSELREIIDAGHSLKDFLKEGEKQCAQFKKLRAKHLLYKSS